MMKWWLKLGLSTRLFSLKRNLALTDLQQEDFEVVSEEMRRLDNIVRNFLEFSKPHKFKKQRIDISNKNYINSTNYTEFEHCFFTHHSSIRSVAVNLASEIDGTKQKSRAA